MRRKLLLTAGALAIAAGALAVTAPRVDAGPPCICWPIDIGDAESLPWRDGAFAADKRYDVRDLVEDTLDLLDDDTPVLVRMETLRRATIYSRDEKRYAYELLSRLMSRVLETEDQGAPRANAWFDVGYLVVCCEQLNIDTGTRGYQFAEHGRKLAKGDPAMELAGALMSAMGNKKVHARKRQHIRRILNAPSVDPLVMRNLRKHFASELAKTTRGADRSVTDGDDR